jgi:hypothetical protein
MKEVWLKLIDKINWRTLTVICVFTLMVLGIITKGDLFMIIREIGSIFK